MGLFTPLKNYLDALIEYSEKFRPVQMALLNPSLARETKRKMINQAVNSLSPTTFNSKAIVNSIIRRIDMKESVSGQYKSVEGQVDGILIWLPRIKQRRDMLEKAVRKNRKKYGLKL